MDQPETPPKSRPEGFASRPPEMADPNKNGPLEVDGFHRLLEWLNPDPDHAGEAYERIRRSFSVSSNGGVSRNRRSWSIERSTE